MSEAASVASLVANVAASDSDSADTSDGQLTHSLTTLTSVFRQGFLREM